VGRAAVRPQELHALEAVGQSRSGLAVALAALALPDRALVPLDAEPAEILEDRLLPARKVPGRIGVVDPQQKAAAEVAVGDGAERSGPSSA
jgi:hypothetical protein